MGTLLATSGAFQSALITVIVLYVIVLFPLMLKSNANRSLGALLIVYPLVLINALHWQLPVIQLAATALVGPLLYNFIQYFFKEKSAHFLRPHFLSVILILIAMVTFDRSITILVSTAVLVLIYSYFSWQTIQLEIRSKGISLFRNPGKRLSWFRNFVLLQGIVIGLLLFSINSPITTESYTLILVLITNVLLIYTQIFRESRFFSGTQISQKYAKSSLTPEQKYSILNRLEKLMTEERSYVDPNITLTELSDKLHTTHHNLSQVLNEQKGQTFAEYLMKYRVDEARKIIRNDPKKHLKIENIALQVGYNSKSAFNAAFKRFTNLTPSEFRQLKNVRDYREERLAGRTIRYYGIKQRNFDLYLNQIDMVRNFLKIFSRNLIRNKVFTLINLFGLVLGFTSSLLIYLFITDELSYDKTIPNANDIYRVAWYSGTPQTRTPHPMAQAMVRDFPEVESAVTITPWYGAGLSKQDITVKNIKENIQFEEPDFYFVDSTFFDVFNLELISGNKQTALKQPGGIIITESMALKYFGTEDPLGQRLAIGDDQAPPAEVVGVIEDSPSASHFHYNFLISYVTLKAMIGEDSFWMQWADFGHFNYIKLKEGSDFSRLESKIAEWFLGYNDWSESAELSLLDGRNKFKLQPITNIHLYSNLRWELETNGNILYIYILFAAVIFILTIASINYINLTTAKSVERAKEIGIRKTLGALKSHLSFQFLTESVLFCWIAGLIALILTISLLPNFNELSAKSFVYQDLFNLELLSYGFIGTFLIGLVSGIYPSLALSSYKPSEILKGSFSKTNKGNLLRRVLVISQFVISAILISASLIILKQTNYLKEKPLGFDQNYLVTIPIKSSEMRSRHLTLTTEFQRLSNVISAAAVSNVPGGQFNQNNIWIESDPNNSIGVSEMTIDYNTIQTLGFEITDGRNFEESYALDSAGGSFILNESAIRQLNLEEPIGTKIVWNLEEGDREGRVIGVVKDFHFKSLHETIQPMIIDMNRSLPGHFMIRIKEENIQSTIDQIKTLYAKFDTTHDFEYIFLDQSIDELYNAEIRTLNIFGIFSVIALILACLGLLGIVISMMHQKIKEVGIRKIHGASSGQILWMINWQFSKLILIALVIGLPLSYLLMIDWISEFPYQVDLGIFPFLISVFVLAGVALVTTSIVVTRVASTNLAEALRAE